MPYLVVLSRGIRWPTPSDTKDLEYTSRHHDAGDETLVSDISNMVYRWPSKVNTSNQLLDKLQSWGRLSGRHGGLKLSYSRDWLQQDLPRIWVSLYDLCRESTRDNRFQLLFSLSALAYQSSAEGRSLIPTLLAFATVPRFRTLPPPSWPSYDLSKGFQPQRDELLKIVLSSTIPFQSSPEANLQANYGEKEANLAHRRLSSFETRRDSRAQDLVTNIIRQWPCEQPSSPLDTHMWPFNIPGLMSKVNTLFRSWFQNTQLRDHIARVQVALNEASTSDLIRPTVPVYHSATNTNNHLATRSFISFQHLLERDAPKLHQPPSILGVPDVFREYRQPARTTDLQSLLSEFQCSQSNPFYRLYGDDLDESRNTLDDQILPVYPSIIPYSLEALAYHRDQCKRNLQDIIVFIYQSLSPSNYAEETLLTAGLWPRVTTRSLLGKLARSSNTVLTSQWRKALVSLAQAMIWYQRSQRLLRWALFRNSEEFFKELENKGYESQGEMQYLDWLLIQVHRHFFANPPRI